jgi:hypothetical protein
LFFSPTIGATRFSKRALNRDFKDGMRRSGFPGSAYPPRGTATYVRGRPQSH